MNDLRYKIPTFAYTLGAFIDQVPKKDGTVRVKKTETARNIVPSIQNSVIDKKSIFILYEKIEGPTLDSLLEQGLMNFDDILVVFIQILFSLEIAQREFSFTHFDMHNRNIMIKQISESYTFTLDDKQYTIQNGGYTPVIIDFGLSTSKINKKPVGSFEFAEYGMVNFMVPGYDMYKFMTQSYHIPGVLDLFEFFGNDDPYNLFQTRDTTRPFSEFCRNVTYSKAGSYTPMMMIKWLLDRYPQLHNNVSISDRNMYHLTNNYFTTVSKYDEIFSFVDNKLQESINESFDRVKNNKSYISGVLLLQSLYMFDKAKIGNVKDFMCDFLVSYKDEDRKSVV